MKYTILLAIQLYWFFKSKNGKAKCIFKKSCSTYVYEKTKAEGFIIGTKAFLFRYKNCRGGFEIFKSPITNKTQILLHSKIIVESEEIANRFLIH
ncbi:membrane protein insertion efficiency factor YidD [uncultured Flavobacterium sp.]|uniref:membrane protein insertion efficiency factor YidD n=1 Tax=uncultured Flavobacterium sp. TaxID=165435 RepID=UPI0030EC9DA1|tara:strand:- start:5546 stop:5830 length:285 start_codon:yes stop_codon:yes gene_type:complete